MPRFSIRGIYLYVRRFIASRYSPTAAVAAEAAEAAAVEAPAVISRMGDALKQC